MALSCPGPAPALADAREAGLLAGAGGSAAALPYTDRGERMGGRADDVGDSAGTHCYNHPPLCAGAFALNMFMDCPRSTQLAYHCYPNGDVDIYRVAPNGQHVLWVLVRDSAGLALLKIDGKGLYAGQEFEDGTCWGRYVGKILGDLDDTFVETLVKDMLKSSKGDALLSVVAAGSGIVYVIDGRQPVQSSQQQFDTFGEIVLRRRDWRWPGVYCHFANDAHGMEHAQNNCQLQSDGRLVINQPGGVPAYRQDLPFTKNLASELFFSYGKGYWS